MNPISFLQTAFTLFTQPSAINDLLDKSLWFVIRFFIIGILLISLIDTSVLLTKKFPEWMNLFRQDLALAVEQYPDDLIISWDGQRLDFSSKQVIVVPYPPRVLPDTEGLPPIFTLVAPEEVTLISEKTTDLHPDQALFYLTQQYIYTNSPSISGQGWGEFPLTEIPGFETPFVVDKLGVPQVAENVSQTIEQTVANGWLAIVLVMFLFLLVTKAWLVLWYALIAWLFFKFYSGKITFNNLLKLSLFLAVIAQTIASISSGLFAQTNTSYLFGISYLVLFFIFFTQIRYKKE